uniref:Uncharacterized protein n=1 Tax=Vitis vinifera TaxID=29760 RepID=A5C6N2_VITVI|nr:hypothetical protein VITISV_031486 [Vitis vinifera]
MEAKEGGKEVDLPTCKLEHKEESETEKEKREEIKGKRKGKSIEKDDYIDEEPQRIVIKEEMMKKHMHPLFPQALYGKIIQTKSQILTTTQSSFAQEMSTIRAHQEQILATQTQHTAILRQLQHHLGLPSAAEHLTPTTAVPRSGGHHRCISSTGPYHCLIISLLLSLHISINNSIF